MNVISTAPTRLGIVGGGTDTNPYAEKYGGVCINMAINLRQQVVLGGLNNLLDGDSQKFFSSFTSYPVVHFKDMPTESGLGSSASLAVALLGAVNKMDNKQWTRDQIAEKAWDIEVNKLGLFGGRQDQYASVYGGLNLWRFNSKVVRQPFPRKLAEELSKYIVLFYTGETRKNTKIQEELKELSPEQKYSLDQIKQMANVAYNQIYKGDYKGLGKTLQNSWEYKKKSNPKVTNSRVDEVYNTMMTSGAWGAKLSGSGGGGFCFCIADDHDKIINKMESIGCTHYDFSPDFQGLETRKLP